MKKVLKILLMISMLTMMLIGCSKNVETPVKNEDNPNEMVTLVETSEVIKRIEDGKSFTFIIGNDECPACAAYKENLKEFKEKENVALDYISLGQSTDREELRTLLADVLGEDISEGFSTPTTYFIVDGELMESVIGPITADSLIDNYLEYIK